MSKTVGIDASTQGVTALLFDTKRGTVLAQSSVSFGRDLPHYEAPSGFVRGKNGAVLADPLMWLEALDLCLGQLHKQADLSEVVAISGAGQQHGTVYLNARGLARLKTLSVPHIDLREGFSRPLSPIWMDQSTGSQCRAIEAALGGSLEVCRRSGSIAIERFSGPQIKRFAETNPEAYAKTARIHLVSSFMASVLAGCDGPIDGGDGAGMNLLNLDKMYWDEQLLTATAPGLSMRLPEVVPSGTVVGRVAPWLVKRHGFSAEAHVVAFTGDNPSSLVGMGDCGANERLISLGTSDTVFGRQESVRTDPSGAGHVFGHPLGGTMALQCFVNGSLAREKIREALRMDWSTFERAIEDRPVGNDGYYLLPFFEPEISPKLPPTGVVAIGSKTMDWRHDKASARACIEGQALNMRLQSAWMGPLPERIYLTGGASQNRAIAQIVANVFGAPVHRVETPESVALGGAVRAGLAVGATSIEAYREHIQSEADNSVRPEPGAALIYETALEQVREVLRKIAEGG